MRLQRDATTRAARTSTRPGRPPVHLDSRGYVSPLGQEDQQGASPPSRPPSVPVSVVAFSSRGAHPSVLTTTPLPPLRPRRARNSRDAPTTARAPSSSSPSVSSWTTASSSPRACSSARAAFASPRRTPRTTSTSRRHPRWSAIRESTTGRRPKLTRAAGEDGEDAPPPRAPPRRGDRAPPPARNEEPRASPPSETRRASPSVVVATRRTPNAAFLPFRELWVGFHAHAVRRSPGSPSASKIRRRGGRGDASRGRDDAERGFGFSGGESRARRGERRAPGDERFGVDTGGPRGRGFESHRRRRR